MSVPQIDDELAESLRILAELEARLPAIRTQATQLQLVYDSGRQKVSVARIFCICKNPFTDSWWLKGRSGRAGPTMVEPWVV
jgi:hypothetical protein